MDDYGLGCYIIFVVDINKLRMMNSKEKIAVTSHAQVRLGERKISIDDVMRVIAEGEIIKQYEDDKPLPSCLLLGMSIGNRFLHIVVSCDDEYIYLITAYYPTSDQWESDCKTRRR